jgi:plastocyanin
MTNMTKRNIWLLLVVGVVLVGLGGFLVSENLRAGAETRQDIYSCVPEKTRHTVTIEHDKLSDTNIQAHRCDILTIVNRDDVTREIGFGAHDKHVAYNGIAEQLLGKGESFSVTLNKTGTYHFHDHFHDELAATFTVTD